MAKSGEAFVVKPWEGAVAPGEAALRDLLRAEGKEPYRWSNGPGDAYAAHSHSYDKTLYVVEGSITFHLPASGEDVHLTEGDRLELKAGVRHAATVGGRGVVCLEAHS